MKNPDEQIERHQLARIEQLESDLAGAKEHIEHLILRDDTFKKITKQRGKQLASVTAERDELLTGLKALYEAMIRYEGDVGGDAPHEHHEMMRSVAKIIAKGEIND